MQDEKRVGGQKKQRLKKGRRPRKDGRGKKMQKLKRVGKKSEGQRVGC